MLLMLTMLTQSRSWIKTSTEILLQKYLIKTICQKNFNGGNLQIFQTKQSNKLSTVNKNMGCVPDIFLSFQLQRWPPLFYQDKCSSSKVRPWVGGLWSSGLALMWWFLNKINKVLKPLQLWAEWLCLSYRLTWIEQSV